MTVRETYEIVSLRMKKRKAPALYPKDFAIYLNAAITDRCNIMYANYEKTQLLSDDLQNCMRHVIINIDDDTPFPFNIVNVDGTPFIQFYATYEMNNNGAIGFFSNYVEDLNPTDINDRYRRKSDNDLEILENSIFDVVYGIPSTVPTAPPILDQLVVKNISDGIIIGIKANATIRDYRFGNNTNYLPFGFNLFDQGSVIMSNSSNIRYFKYNASTRMFDFIYGSGYNLLPNGTSMIIHTPSNYWHTTGMTSVLDYKKSIACEKTLERRIGVRRLTDQVRANINTGVNIYSHPSVKRKNNYFHELNNLNSVYPDIELLYCSEEEKNLVQLRQVDLYYLKEPKKYVLDDEDCRGVDNTESLEFQDYICHDILEQVELLLLERDGNPRLQTQPLINNTLDSTRANQ